MVGPFPKKPISAEGWRSKARAYQAQLEGFSIDELMRGPIGEVRPAGSAGSHDSHARNQPRAPKVTPMEGSGYAPAMPTAGSQQCMRCEATRATRPRSSASTAAETSAERCKMPTLRFQAQFPRVSFPRETPPEFVLRAMNRKATVYSDTGAPDAAGPISGTATILANGFEVTNGTFGIVARNLANGRIDGAIFSVPRGSRRGS